ncbi:hypothetical protein GEV43_35075 [Actinomadura sp. J1-007]|nr:hypothetical protein [Actinomadura sp. J1-007]
MPGDFKVACLGILLSLVQALHFVPLGAGVALVARLPGWPVWNATLWVAEILSMPLPPVGDPYRTRVRGDGAGRELTLSTAWLGHRPRWGACHGLVGLLASF